MLSFLKVLKKLYPFRSKCSEADIAYSVSRSLLSVAECNRKMIQITLNKGQ